MKILTIVGNGFDLGHRLPTSFDAFIKSNYSVFSEKYTALSGGIGTWTYVEEVYGELLCKIISERSWHDITETVEQIIHDYGLNEYGEVNYYNYSSDAFEEEYCLIQSYVDLLTEFEKDFQQYLRRKCSNDVLAKLVTFDNVRQILSSSDQIISFNYTSTIETAYRVTNVAHIHGKVDASIAIGSGALDEVKESLMDIEYPTIDKFGRDKYGFQELLGYYEYDDEGNRYPKVFIERFFSEVAGSAQEREVELFNLLDIKNKEALGSRISITDNLAKEHYDKVYIIGHALGEADYSVFDAINKDAEVICSYYLEDEKDKLEHTLKRLKLQYTMVPSQEIFK